MSVSDL